MSLAIPALGSMPECPFLLQSPKAIPAVQDSLAASLTDNTWAKTERNQFESDSPPSILVCQVV